MRIKSESKKEKGKNRGKITGEEKIKCTYLIQLYKNHVKGISRIYKTRLVNPLYSLYDKGVRW